MLSAGFQRIVPSHSSPTCRAETSCSEIRAFLCQTLIWEATSRFHNLTVTGIQAFNRICRTNHFPDLNIAIEERNEFVPHVFPKPDDRGAFRAPVLFQRVEGIRSSVRAGSRIDGPQVTLDFFPIFLGRGPEWSPDQMDDACLHCRQWPDIAYHLWQTLRPSRKRMKTSLTPLLRMSFRTDIHNLAA